MRVHRSVSSTGEIAGELHGRSRAWPIQVLGGGRHTLFVKFQEGAVPSPSSEFDTLKLRLDARELALGKCRYFPHAAVKARRHDDPPTVGDGRIVFVDQLYDFSSLPRNGMVVELKRRLEQLPVLWGRKKEIRGSFREYIAETLYDLQVYRGLFDEIDRNLQEEPPEIRAEVHTAVVNSEYPAFKELFERQLAELARQTADFSLEEHERHGFYLRKHAWDLIRASEFLLRTNLKPRGYPGDSQMMRMVYENEFRGPTIFSQFMHRHPLEVPAAQAVRNRVSLLADRIGERLSRQTRGRLRLMSVASGPAWELSRVVRSPEEAARLDVALLDQDTEALGEARTLVRALENIHRTPIAARYIEESVRTMLRTARLEDRWGRFDFVYSMGLFDYLTAPVARVVLKKLYDLLAPGGELVVGNFHVSNQSRLYMEYWMDWTLLHRTEQEFLELSQGLDPAHAAVQFEATGSQMFLCLRKGG